MAAGAYTVKDDPKNPRAILIERSGDAPEEQQTLRGDLERIWIELDRTYLPDDAKAEHRFLQLRYQLKLIAQTGLTGTEARPDIAADMLQQFKYRTVLGAFNIVEEGRKITFTTNFGIKPSEDQLVLKSAVEKFSSQLDQLFPTNNGESPPVHAQYHGALAGLARVGLTGSQPQVNVAARALESLKDELLLHEGPRVKNSYMQKLGVAAGWSAFGSLCIWVMSLIVEAFASGYPPVVETTKFLRTFAPLWLGSMVGTWLSFGARKAVLRFDELAKLEDDLLQPAMRVLYVGLLTMIIGVLFYLHVVTVSVGAVSTELLTEAHPLIALMLGALCGISEQGLANKVVKQAETFLNFK